MHILPIKKAHIVKYGRSYYICIPVDYIKNGLIDPDTKIDAILITK